MEIYLLLLIFIGLEIFESSWQKSDTFYGMIYNNYAIFQKNIFLYFILHSTFFYTIFLSLKHNDFGFWMSSIFLVKFFDVAFKLTLMKKLSSGQQIEEIIPMNMAITPVLRYFNVLVYPLCYFFAINS